jgi:hypothetical protein
MQFKTEVRLWALTPNKFPTLVWVELNFFAFIDDENLALCWLAAFPSVALSVDHKKQGIEHLTALSSEIKTFNDRLERVFNGIAITIFHFINQIIRWSLRCGLIIYDRALENVKHTLWDTQKQTISLTFRAGFLCASAGRNSRRLLINIHFKSRKKLHWIAQHFNVGDGDAHTNVGFKASFDGSAKESKADSWTTFLNCLHTL